MRLHTKTILGMGLSVVCMGIGVYVNYWTSSASKRDDIYAQEAIQENYIKTAFPKVKGEFYTSFQSLDEEKAPYTLIAFTSLACHVCSTFHRITFQKIQASPAYTSGALRVIFVEYPADRISFFASGYVWASKSPDQARNRLMDTQESWGEYNRNLKSAAKIEAEQLKKIQNILKTTKTLSQKKLTVLFEKKMEAQKVFGITDVPFFVLYQPNKPKGKRIKTHVGVMEWDMLYSWLEIR
ncbi:DsbA family protein [Holospora curviuscula]|uniref:Thioredoxin-like fold domain-containing protein n=1 Tax=Holospora curviuscula TaxID=1082868 RepID=A0A2S5R9B1_9PROT|nr:thioredoxin domain-containing protein [Holospora curviuscula]PPE03792.1 hypothetical protein HCUR_00807 [Holospora curviuscula]